MINIFTLLLCTWYLLINLSWYLDQETVKRLLQFLLVIITINTVTKYS